MPGPYAHITATLEVAVKPRLRAIESMPDQAVSAVLKFVTYCELGSVSPDLPYMDMTDPRAMRWADLFHERGSGDFLKTGIAWLRERDGEVRDKCLAWLLGFASHVAMDVAVHPIINLRVGPYEQNKTEHRKCELNEDVYIYQRLDLGDVGRSEHFRTLGGPARHRFHRATLDRDIETFWDHILATVYPDTYARSRPRLTAWYRWYRRAIDKVAEEATLIPFARHVGANLGLVYPTVEEIDDSFIHRLELPDGSRGSYDEVFDRGEEALAEVWGWIASGVYTGDTRYQDRLTNWNLNTGFDEDGNLVFWS